MRFFFRWLLARKIRVLIALVVIAAIFLIGMLIVGLLVFASGGGSPVPEDAPGLTNL